MTLYVLAGIFAVLGIVCILLPFHVAMTGLCFLALGAVCLALRLLRGKKHERTWRMILLTLTGVCMLTVFGAMMYIDREGRSNVQEEGKISTFAAACTALGSSIGASNIVGVPVAIALGGPGAVFWMWIIAIVGCCTKYCEIALAVK